MRGSLARKPTCLTSGLNQRFIEGVLVLNPDDIAVMEEVFIDTEGLLRVFETM